MELSDKSADTVPTRSLTTSNNERLPYDILGVIFHQYSLVKPLHSGIIKLETLLLVCRAWSFAALVHRTLWSRLEVRIYYREDLMYWKIHVPLRLSRSSPTALLDIVLNLVRWSLYKQHSPREMEMLRSIVLDLVGPEGCVAKRWRTLYLGSIPDSILPLFCVPTPVLVDLELADIADQEQCLPETPVLETFCTNCSSWQYPDLQNVTNLTIRAERPVEVDAVAISKAQKLIKLTVMYGNRGGQLRGDFPVLEYLHLHDVLEEGFFNGFSAPRLKILSLDHCDRESYRNMLKSLGIRFHALEELIICLDSRQVWRSIDTTHSEGVLQVLQAAVNIDVLRTTSKDSLATMLGILSDLSVCQDHHFTLKYSDYSMVLHQGEARRASIDAIRLEVDL